MKKMRILPIILAMCVILGACGASGGNDTGKNQTTTTNIVQEFDLNDIPEYNGSAHYIVNNNVPYFEKSDMTTKSFEEYGNLDRLGRCTTAYACVGIDTMPTTKRGAIGEVKPTGWHTVKYDNVDGKYLYNRCHLIGYQLTAENANEKNLITGTRYMNVDGMLEYEDEVADYVKSTNNHVLYRVTPIFNDNELVARGVLMEAKSVEDNGEGVCYNVYCYNVQPDIKIDYATGESSYAKSNVTHANGSEKQTFIVNVNTKKFHRQGCQFAEDIADENKKAYIGYRESLINNGFIPCKACKP